MLLHSIETLDPDNIIDTMNRPIVVNSSDMNLYFCKYNRLAARAYRLYKEYLIASFLPIWGFNSNPINLIKINDEHIPSGLGIKRSCFESPCFGLQMIESSNELDKHYGVPNC
ncbi:hypothetical protein SAMN05518672_1061 [Chitinophaga sp. CF118]|nr:hypothetical protein SAMN05518672_1061 [Chitinophaga sp. CF118]